MHGDTENYHKTFCTVVLVPEFVTCEIVRISFLKV